MRRSIDQGCCGSRLTGNGIPKRVASSAAMAGCLSYLSGNLQMGLLAGGFGCFWDWVDAEHGVPLVYWDAVDFGEVTLI